MFLGKSALFPCLFICRLRVTSARNSMYVKVVANANESRSCADPQIGSAADTQKAADEEPTNTIAIPMNLAKSNLVLDRAPAIHSGARY